MKRFAGTAAYLTPDAGANLHEFGIEASRSWRGVSVWAAMKALGRQGVAQLVTQCCDLTAELARRVEAADRLELTAPAPSCVCCFRYRGTGTAAGEELDTLNRRVQAVLAREGNVFVTGAELRQGFSLRAAVVSWRTTLEDIETLVAAVQSVGDAVMNGRDTHGT